MIAAIAYIVDGYTEKRITADDAMVLIRACLSKSEKKDDHKDRGKPVREFPPLASVDPNRQVRDYEASARTRHCLAIAGIKTTMDLYRLDEWELRNIQNFGKKSLQELVEILNREAQERAAQQ